MIPAKAGFEIVPSVVSGDKEGIANCQEGVADGVVTR